MSIMYGQTKIDSIRYKGLVKVKLVHTQNSSLIIPDQLFLHSPQVWLQPKTWLPPILSKVEGRIIAVMFFDIAEGVTLRISFEENDLITYYSDGSFLYKCTIEGPKGLSKISASKWFFSENRPFLQVFHHTGLDAKDNIIRTKEFWQSSWNIQGTKRLENIGYVYFTPIAVINSEIDLQRIGMSSRKVLYFLRDGANVPKRLPENWKTTKLAEDILELPVYWSATEERKEKICIYVDATTLAPQHAWRHTGNQVWYEVAFPDILRVGIKPLKTLSITPDWSISPDHEIRKQFDYIILGDAGTLEGLASPMSEETTNQKFKIHKTLENPLSFWFENSNKDHYTKLHTEYLKFRDL